MRSNRNSVTDSTLYRKVFKVLFRILTAGSYKCYDDVFIKEIGKCTCVHSDVLTDFIRATGKEESHKIMSRVHKD